MQPNPNQLGPPPAKSPEAANRPMWYDESPVLPVIVQSQIAFYRDLPELLKSHSRQWVAYLGDQRIGFGRTGTELYRECLRRGLNPEEFVVLFVDHSALSDHDPIDLPFPVSAPVAARRPFMGTILRNLPFYDDPTIAVVRGQRLAILPRQIIVWVSLGPRGLDELDVRTPRFPAVLDTGFTDNFLIHEQQFRFFTGLQLQHLPSQQSFLITADRRVPVHVANVWLHRNRPGRRDDFSQGSPFLLDLHRGIGICQDADNYPRLPLLGARALRQVGLQVHLDYQRFRVSMRSPRRFWFFG